MSRREIVEARLLRSLKAGPKGTLFKPMTYYAPNIPKEIIEEYSLNRGTVIVRFEQITVPPIVTVEVTNESESTVEVKQEKETHNPETIQASENQIKRAKSVTITRRKK